MRLCVGKAKAQTLPPSPKNMTPQEYLEQELATSARYTLSEEDQKVIKFEGVGVFIFRKLKSKKFRKTKIDPSSEEVVKKAIKLNVEKNEPIKFSYPFGGYKIWRLPTYPEVDWAEFMAIAYIVQYVAPIAAAYGPGVEITFTSDDKVIELIDNYPRKSLDAYIDSFRKLLGEFEKHLPKNLKAILIRIEDLYDSPADYQNVAKEMNDQLKKEGLTDQRMAEVKKGFDFNFMWKGKEDFTKLSEEKKEKLIDELIYWSESYFRLTKRRAFNRGETKIVLFSNPLPNALDIGSTRVSKAKFWAGTGVLEHDGGEFFDRIISPKQWEENKDEAKEVPIDLIPLKNFKTILVFDKRLDFLRD